MCNFCEHFRTLVILGFVKILVFVEWKELRQFCDDVFVLVQCLLFLLHWDWGAPAWLVWCVYALHSLGVSMGSGQSLWIWAAVCLPPCISQLLFLLGGPASLHCIVVLLGVLELGESRSSQAP